MRLFEAIIEANHRAVAGDAQAGLRPADYAAALPVVALTCLDPRLNAFLPNVLGLPGDQFIWLRNAGNIITGPLSSTMRSIALACAVEGGQEVVIIGHTDCGIGRMGIMQLLERFQGLGIKREHLPDNLTEFFGSFSSERQNVIRAAEIARGSPILGSKVPVHGLLLDLETGRLEWLVNGYQVMAALPERPNAVMKAAEKTVDALKALADFKMGEMKFPQTPIGDVAGKAVNWMAEQLEKPAPDAPPASAAQPPKTPEPKAKLPLPPRIRARQEGRPRPKWPGFP